MLKIIGKFGRFLTKQLERLDPDTGQTADSVSTSAAGSTTETANRSTLDSLLPIYDASGHVMGYTLPPPASKLSGNVPRSSRSSYRSRKSDNFDEATVKSSTRSRSTSPIFKRAKDGTFVQIQRVVKAGTRAFKRVRSDDESDIRESDSERRHVKKRRRGTSFSSSRVGRSLKRALSSSESSCSDSDTHHHRSKKARHTRHVSFSKRQEQSGHDTDSSMSVDEPRHSRKHHHGTSSSSKPASCDPVHLNFHSHPTVERDSKSKVPDPPPSTKKSGHDDEPINSALLYMKSENLEDTWDGYPDGNFTLDITHDVFAKTKHLMMHWPCAVTGGDPGHSKTASTWQEGKKSTRKCLGYIKCTNDECQVLVRPHTKPASRARQLEKPCICSAPLRHIQCTGGDDGKCIIAVTHTWSGGVRFVNSGFHRHPRPTHELHLDTNAELTFKKLVNENPHASALKLLTGLPRLDGSYGPSVATIAPPLLNAGRVNYQRDKVKRAANISGSHFLRQYAAFKKNRPGFVIQEHLDTEIVISVQGEFMKAMLIRETIDDRPLNGMVSDAAHGWWRVRSDLLIVTSVYCAFLCCWVPVIFSFTNGASAEHFKYHFYALFKGMQEQAAKKGVALEIEWLANVIDFSEAERTGFILAYILFFSEQDSTRTASELRAEAESLLKGCEQHFRSACTRLARIGNIIPPETKDEFLRICNTLRTSEDTDRFRELAVCVVRKWPKTPSWMEWWTREAHASMIFHSHRKMAAIVWDSIPDTTNPEESLHGKMYKAAGRDHDVMDGFEGLYAVSEYFKAIYDGVKKGALIRYGTAEPWKLVHERIGRTKPTRAPEAVAKRAQANDGRPPDTKAKLDRRSQAKAKVILESNLDKLPKPSPPKPSSPKPSPPKPSPPTAPKVSQIPGLPWDTNSCWLDASCTAINAVLRWDWDAYGQGFASRKPKRTIFDALYELMTSLYNQQELNASSKTCDYLKAKRNMFRKALIDAKYAKPFIVHEDGTEEAPYHSAFDWLDAALRDERDDNFSAMQSFFHAIEVEILFCGGSSTHQSLYPGDPQHIKLRQPRISTFWPNPNESHEFNGSLERWFQARTTVDQIGRTRAECWRSENRQLLCDGAGSTVQFITHIPIALIINFSPEAPTDSWDIPLSFKPLSAPLDNDFGLEYELVSRVFFINGNHFVTHSRFPTPKGSQTSAIYFHDSFVNNGNYISLDGAETGTHLAGGKLSRPPFSGHGPAVTTEVIYRLRGGLKAQEAFISHQLDLASRIYHLEFSSQAFTQIPSVYLNRPNYSPLRPDQLTWSVPSSRRVEYQWTSSVMETTPTTDHPHPTSTVLSRPCTPESEEHVDPLNHRQPSPGLTPMPSSSPAPSDEVHLLCRCGAEGDGDRLEMNDGALIQCSGTVLSPCGRWSHLACQRGLHGHARQPRLKKFVFTCQYCNVSTAVEASRGWTAFVAKEAKRLEKEKELVHRLLPGKGALVRLGEYWYPVRLISVRGKQWSAKLWRHCYLPKESKYHPGEVIKKIPEDNIRDECWKNRSARRKMRLGHWDLTHLVKERREDADTFASDVVGYTTEIDRVLLPHHRLLCDLMVHPLEVKPVSAVPALDFVLKSRQPLTAAIPYSGGIARDDWSRIDHWFTARYPDVNRLSWVSKLPMAHAGTLLSASRIQKANPSVDFHSACDSAWEQMITLTGKTLAGEARFAPVDVDLEAIQMLEDRMFTHSKAAGIAGNRQWGLDAGHHQDGWSPYHNECPSWSDDARHGEDREVEPGPNYIDLRKADDTPSPRQGQITDQQRPKPRQTRKRRKEA